MSTCIVCGSVCRRGNGRGVHKSCLQAFTATEQDVITVEIPMVETALCNQPAITVTPDMDMWDDEEVTQIKVSPYHHTRY